MTLVKKYWREITIAILIIVVSISVTTCNNKSSLSEILLHVNDSAFNVARHYYNRNGELVQQVSVQELTIGELKKMAESMGTDKEKLKEQVGNLNNLVGYWKGQAGFKGKDSVRWKDSIRFVDRNKDGIAEDTVDFKNFGWSNQYLTINEDYYPYDNVVVLEYQYDLGGFDLTVYRKKMERVKGKLFRKKQLVADMKFGDQNMKVSKFEGVLVKEKKKPLKWWHWVLIGAGGGLIVDNVTD